MLPFMDERALGGDGDEIAHTCGSAVQIWNVSNFYLTTCVSVHDTRLP